MSTTLCTPSTPGFENLTTSLINTYRKNSLFVERSSEQFLICKGCSYLLGMFTLKEEELAILSPTMKRECKFVYLLQGCFT